MITKKLSIAVISTYPFKESGISQYTKDLISSEVFRKSFKNVHIFSAAIKTERKRNIADIDFTDIWDLISTAKTLNQKYDVVNIQFDEYYFHNNRLLELNYFNFYTFLSSIEIPAIVTLHFGFTRNVFFDKIMRLILDLPNIHIIVQSKSHKEYIQKITKNINRVHLIYHGYPDNIRKLSVENAVLFKKFRKRNENKIVLLTLGYFGEWKNQLNTIKLISGLIKQGLPIVYYLIGSDIYGRSYYLKCKKEIESENMRGRIILKNKYLSGKKFNFYLKCADVYIAHHQNYNNFNPSGTITYALGAGVPVISSVSPFTTSPDINSLLIVTKGNKDFLNKVSYLVANAKKRKIMSGKSLDITRSWSWSNVSKSYLKLIFSAINNKELFVKNKKTTLIYLFVSNIKGIKNVKKTKNGNITTVYAPVFSLPVISKYENKLFIKISRLFQVIQLKFYLDIFLIRGNFKLR